jgi:hypothetical protein
MAAIRYLKREEIDKARWDTCIDKAANGLIYAYSFYLDAMCDNWDGLILNDYEAVMPLPWRKKWGVKYIYQPAFIQRLGVFAELIDNTILDHFFIEATKKFSFLHYNISGTINNSKANLVERKNFLIELQNGYPQIRAAYTKECVKNIKKSETRGCRISHEIRTEEVIELFRSAYGALNTNTSEKEYNKLADLIKKGIEIDKVALSGVKDNKGNTLFGAAIFKDNKRLYYVIGAPTAHGREKRATYFFIDYILKANAGQPMIFDFEGSDISNVAFFYQQFGPITEYYYELKINSLPSIISWLKR